MDALFIFTRFPQAGCTKTRLIPALGERGAADVQRQMTEHLLKQLKQTADTALSLQIHFAGGSVAQMANWLGDRYPLVPQSEGDLGDRLAAAFSQGFTSGLNKIIIIGSDCPSLGNEKISAAITLLNHHDVVLGPAADGGYYLIGLNRPHLVLFESVPWSTAQVLAVTEAIAAKHTLSVALLEVLSDIDSPEDLPLWDDLRAVS